MGKDLKGRELGEGVSQKPNGKYLARYRNCYGKRPEKVFDKLNEAKKWIAEMKYEEEYERGIVSSNLTVDQWWKYWYENFKKPQLKPTTLFNYECYYKNSIKKEIGNLRLFEVKPIHCQKILVKMTNEGKAHKSIKAIRCLMYALFRSAEENGIIIKNPVTPSVKSNGAEKKEKKILEKHEQERLLKELKKSTQYNAFAFVLQTGLRIGELAGLRWEDIDFVNKKFDIKRNVVYIGKPKEFIVQTPKTANGLRTIPLTEKAIAILQDQKKLLREREKDQPISLLTRGYVFKTVQGQFLSDSALNDCLYRACKRAKIQKTSMHGLRHTFATRCIEAGMRPKTLQKILGHANIAMTMNLYVHVSEEAMIEEMKKFELFA